MSIYFKSGLAQLQNLLKNLDLYYSHYVSMNIIRIIQLKQ